MEYVEEARAKINLTLKVLGRLENGYHALQSLVAFANISDFIRFIPGSKTELKTTGPFAKDLKGQNLIEKVLLFLHKQHPELILGQVVLEKNLPVASGIGGGSADAAAVLRAIRKANKNIKTAINWNGLASNIGADVPVCLQNQATWMSGVGDCLLTLPNPLPSLSILLVNPMLPVPSTKTADVFGLLNAKSIEGKDYSPPKSFPNVSIKKDLLSVIKYQGNDLLPSATHLVPEIERVLDVLKSCEGQEISSLSGAGPTCFGIFENNEKAEKGRGTIRQLHPSWWIKVGNLS